MSRSRLRALEVAGLRLAIEVPAGFEWDWPRGYEGFACSPDGADVEMGVRVTSLADDCARIDDSIVYETDGGTVEIGRRGADWILRATRAGQTLRVATFDPSFRYGEIRVDRSAADALEYPLAGLEELLVHEALVRRGGFLVSGSAQLVGRRATVDLGATPAGEAGHCLARSSLALRVAERGVRAYALPWDAVPGRGDRLCAGVDSLRVVGCAPVQYEQRIGGEEAVDRIAPFAFAPLHDSVSAEYVLDNVAAVCARIPTFRSGVLRHQGPLPVDWRSARASRAPSSHNSLSGTASS